MKVKTLSEKQQLVIKLNQIDESINYIKGLKDKQSSKLTSKIDWGLLAVGLWFTSKEDIKEEIQKTCVIIDDLGEFKSIVHNQMIDL